MFSIELHAGNDPSWLEHDAKLKERAREYADRILQDLEEAGIEPPIVKEKSFKMLDSGEMVYAVHEWDEED